VENKTLLLIFPRQIRYNFKKLNLSKEGEMKKLISVFPFFLLIGFLLVSLVGCGADIKAENEKLKAENAALKSDNNKLNLEIQKLKEELQKMAEKEATLSQLTAENEALKKQVEELKAQLAKKKKK